MQGDRRKQEEEKWKRSFDYVDEENLYGFSTNNS